MDVFDLYAKLSLDSKDYDRSLQGASNAADQWATKFAMAAKTVSSLASSVFGLAKQAVDSYANFEQLEGGIETLFGTQGKSFDEWSKSFTESSDSMQDYVDVARKVINGDFGRGAERKDLLSAAGYDPDTVQQMVNNLINGVDVASNISADTIAANMQTAEEKYASLERAQNAAMENAKRAYATVGMSANDYMNTVTSFAASLIQGLDGDTEKAVNYADRALQDMADNSNKMGTNMASIQAAYQGFSKQNYTMLDNLKLGYGGTKTEMERLIKDAAKLTNVQEELGVTVDANSMSFDNIVNAISVVQKQMGITGTTAQEASETIQGSQKALEASWQNVLTSLVTGGEFFDQSIEGLAVSMKNFIKNIVPAFQGALYGIGKLVESLAPIISSQLPTLVADIVPGFVNAIIQIVASLMDVLPDLLGTLSEVAPIVIDALADFIPTIIDFLVESIPQFVSTGIQMLTSLASGIADNIPTIVPQLSQAMIDIADQLIDIVSTGGANFGSAGLAVISALADSLVTAVPSVLTQVTQLIQDLTASISNAAEGDDESLLATATTILTDLVDGLLTSIPTIVPQLTSAVSEFITKFADLAGENTTSLANAAIGILNSLVTSLGDSNTISNVMTDITTAVMAIIDAILGVLTNLDIATFASACSSVVAQIADGIVNSVAVITAKLPELITDIVAWFTNPDNLTGLLDAALTLFGELVADVPGILIALGEGLAGIVSGIVTYFEDHGSEILDGFKQAFVNVGTKMVEIWDEKIKPAFDTLGQKIKDFFLQFEWGQALVDFVTAIGKAISGAWDLIKDAFTGAAGFAGKVGEWLGSLDLASAARNLVDSLKKGLESAWEGIKTWFTDKFTHLFDDIDLSKLKFWERWGKGGNDEGEDNRLHSSGGGESGGSIEMPEGMLTLDYNNLQPIPEETLISYQTLALAINDINTAISGGEEGTGLNEALSGIPALLDAILASAVNLASFFMGDFVTAISALITALCVASTDEEGNTNAGGGNTLYNSLGAIYGLFCDILGTSRQISEHWTGEFIQASMTMREEAGKAAGVVTSLGDAAAGAAGQFDSLASSIMTVVSAYLALQRAKGGSSRGGGNTGKPFEETRASGGSVHAGSTYLVGEQGPELFSPTQSGYITSNDKLNKSTQIVVNFNGEVIGDEKSISAYVTKAVSKGLRKAVYVGS